MHGVILPPNLLIPIYLSYPYWKLWWHEKSSPTHISSEWYGSQPRNPFFLSRMLFAWDDDDPSPAGVPPHLDASHIATASPLSCMHRGSWKPHGETWRLDECSACSCNNGTTTCHIDTCPVPECPDPVPIAGECCPGCPLGELRLTSMKIFAWIPFHSLVVAIYLLCGP